MPKGVKASSVLLYSSNPKEKMGLGKTLHLIRGLSAMMCHTRTIHPRYIDVSLGPFSLGCMKVIPEILNSKQLAGVIR